MRLACLTAGLALVLAAGPALAEDSSTIPGSKLSGPTFQRPMAQNPEMKPYISAAPKPAAPAPAPAQAAAPPPAMPAAPPRSAALEDAGQLLQQAESEMAKRRLRAADTTLEQAETALLNARSGGDAVPQQALDPLDQARDALRHGRAAEAEQATEAAAQAIAARR